MEHLIKLRGGLVRQLYPLWVSTKGQPQGIAPTNFLKTIYIKNKINFIFC